MLVASTMVDALVKIEFVEELEYVHFLDYQREKKIDLNATILNFFSIELMDVMRSFVPWLV